MWDGEKNSVYLGRGEFDGRAAVAIQEFEPGTNQITNAYLNEDIKIYYYDEVQTFKDVNGTNRSITYTANDVRYLTTSFTSIDLSSADDMTITVSTSKKTYSPSFQ